MNLLNFFPVGARLCCKSLSLGRKHNLDEEWLDAKGHKARVGLSMAPPPVSASDSDAAASTPLVRCKEKCSLNPP